MSMNRLKTSKKMANVKYVKKLEQFENVIPDENYENYEHQDNVQFEGNNEIQENQKQLENNAVVENHEQMENNEPEENQEQLENIDLTENLNTGVIYKITIIDVNNDDKGKIYIGRTHSYQGHGKTQKPSYYSAMGRWKRHVLNAFSKDQKKNNQCPDFYKAIRKYDKNAFSEEKKYGQDNFSVEILRICPKDNKILRMWESSEIADNESFQPEKGFNILVGNNKPPKGKNKEKIENQKANNNRNRCQENELRRSDNTKELPRNITFHTINRIIVGYKAQITDFSGKKRSKTVSSKDFLEKKDELLKTAINNLEELNNKYLNNNTRK
jgi:hypothetical protein